MRAAIFRNGEIVVDRMLEPKPGPGQVLVKTLACDICGSDLHARPHAHRMVELSKHLAGRKPMDLSRDVVFGHEFCCEVLDSGPGAQRRFKPGTRVCSLPALITQVHSTSQLATRPTLSFNASTSLENVSRAFMIGNPPRTG